LGFALTTPAISAAVNFATLGGRPALTPVFSDLNHVGGSVPALIFAEPCAVRGSILAIVFLPTFAPLIDVRGAVFALLLHDLFGVRGVTLALAFALPFNSFNRVTLSLMAVRAPARFTRLHNMTHGLS
jgi:hypothetical protein